MRTKIIIDKKIEIVQFRYLGCDITYYKNRDIKNKTYKSQGIYRTLRRILGKKTRNETQLKVI